MLAKSEYITQRTATTSLLVGVLLASSAIISLYFDLPFYILLLIIVGVCAVPMACSTERIIYFVTFYMVVFGNAMFNGELYPQYYPIVTDGAMVILFILSFWEYAVNGRQLGFRSTMHRVLFVFLLLVIGSGVIGMLHSNNSHILWREVRMLSYYAVYFVAVRHFRKYGQIVAFMSFLVIATLFVTFDYIYTSKSINFARFVSRQVHMLHLVTPFLISLIVLDKNKVRKALYAASLVPILISIFISQTRGSWAAVTIAILISIYLITASKYRGVKKALYGASLVAVFCFFAFISFIYGQKFSKSKLAVADRVETIASLDEDASFLMRANAYLTVLAAIDEHPWFGHGMGDVLTFKFFNQHSTQANVDSTHLTILWKMGVTGFVPFIALYYLFLQQAYKMYCHETDFFLKSLSIGIISAFVAFLILGLISPILVTSRFNFIFGILFAITEVRARDISFRKRFDT